MTDTERLLKAVEVLLAMLREQQAHIVGLTREVQRVKERVDGHEVGIAAQNYMLGNLESILIPPEMSQWRHWKGRIFHNPDIITALQDVEATVQVIERTAQEGLNLG